MKHSNGSQIVRKACSKIYAKTGRTGSFLPTMDITPALEPTTDITKNFPDTEPGCLDLFWIKSNHNNTQEKQYLYR